MASTYKFLGPNDRVVSTTSPTEVNSYSSGSSWTASDKTSFVKILSGSANTNIFDITIGRSGETFNATSTTFDKERTIYNQFAKVLLGHDETGNIYKFSLDADSNTSNNILHNAIFINFARGQIKDKIKRGTFNLLLNVSGTSNVYLTDKSGTLGPTYRETQTGEVGLLYVSSSATTTGLAATPFLTGGLVFYEAGVAVISPYIFSKHNNLYDNPSGSNTYINQNELGLLLGSADNFSGSSNIGQVFASGTISQAAYGLHTNLLTASFQSVTELNSTIYFCRAFNNEFNYSSNPTYLSSSEIVVKESDGMNQPVSYITSVGLYDSNNQLLAVAKLSEPIKKTPDTELIARVRLDF